jgi:4-hydroxy-tetrahydrodipicolinate reductase
MQTIGLIGTTGRMGNLLRQALTCHPTLTYGSGFARSQHPFVPLETIFQHNHAIIDFSHPDLTAAVVEAALAHPKPLVLGTTGWQETILQPLLDRLAQQVPVVIAPNTSLGAFLQNLLVQQLAQLLGEDYDIDVSDKHHRDKIDAPSGTAHALIRTLQETKQQYHGHPTTACLMPSGPRPPHTIGVTVERSGHLPGEHAVSFTGADDRIVIQHTVFDRSIFARGALRIVEWLAKTSPQPGLYTMKDTI